MARPKTAARVWQHRGMRHALVKLYLYTNLSTEDISRLITALAQQQMGDRFKSQKRSTQAALRSLLADKHGKLDHRKLRPRSREAARLRVAWQRSVRDGRRAQKALSRRRRLVADGRSRSLSPTSNPTSNVSSETLVRQSVSHAYFTSFNTENTIENLDPPQHPDSSLEDDQQTMVTNCESAPEHKHVRLSWVRKVMPEVSGIRPSSSMYLEIRSLLSWRSIRSSLYSLASSRSARSSRSVLSSLPGSSSFLAPSEVALAAAFESSRRPATPRASLAQPANQAIQPTCNSHATLIITLCCRYRRNCLHRKVFTAIKGEDLPAGSRADVLTEDDFLADRGRDVLGETVLHIAARWGAPAELFKKLLYQVSTPAINIKSRAGETFMHILALAWICTQPEALLEIFKDALAGGFNHLALNRLGQNFLASLIPPQETRMDATTLSEVSKGLRIFLQAPRSALDGLLAFPGANHQNVADDISEFLQYQAQWTADHQAMMIALSVAREVKSKGARASIGQYSNTAMLHCSPTNLVHQYLESHTNQAHPGQDMAMLSHVERLLLDGADPNDYNTDSMPCVTAVLHQLGQGRLSEANTTSLLNLLVRHGANLRLVDGNCETALHKAIELGLEEVIDTLLHLGADVLATNAAGQSALRCAAGQRARNSSRDGGSRKYSSAEKLLVRMIDTIPRPQKPTPLDDIPEGYI